MPELKLIENILHPGLPIDEDLEIFEDTESLSIKVKDKTTSEVLITLPSSWGLSQ